MEEEGTFPSAPAATTLRASSPRKRQRNRSSSPTAGAQLTSRLAGRFVTFFKLLEGATSLSAAVQALAPAAHVVRAACPRAAVDAARKVLREEFKITIDENIGEGKCRVTRSCYFAKVWQKSLEESGDPETDLPEWLRSGAPVGWKGALAPNGVFPMVDGDMETVKKSMQCSQGSQDKAFNAPATCSPNYTSFADTGSQADAEVKRSLQKGFSQEFDSWKDLVTELGPDSVVNNLGKSIEWLGVIVEPTHRVGRPGVSVTIPASKCTDFVARSTRSLRTAARHTRRSSGAWPAEWAGSQGSSFGQSLSLPSCTRPLTRIRTRWAPGQRRGGRSGQSVCASSRGRRSRL